MGPYESDSSMLQHLNNHLTNPKQYLILMRTESSQFCFHPLAYFGLRFKAEENV